MKPENVNPRNFKISKILYDDGDFSVAYGLWEGREYKLGLRWNGDGDSKGYPNYGKHPMWFVLTDEFKIEFLKMLLNKKNSNNLEILEILSENYK